MHTSTLRSHWFGLPHHILYTYIRTCVHTYSYMNTRTFLSKNWKGLFAFFILASFFLSLRNKDSVQLRPLKCTNQRKDLSYLFPQTLSVRNDFFLSLFKQKSATLDCSFWKERKKKKKCPYEKFGRGKKVRPSSSLFFSSTNKKVNKQW